MPLPKVSEAIDSTLMQDLKNPDFINDIMGRLDAENPIISKMIKELCQKYSEEGKDPSECSMPLDQAIGMALLVYRQLESQVEADDLTAQIYGTK